MEHLPFPDESFDLVLCSWVLEHLADPARAWAEVARVLKSPSASPMLGGGHFVFLTPNALHPLTWISRWLGRLGDWQSRLVERLYARSEADTFPVLYRANTRRRIAALGRAAGLRPVRFCRIGDPTYLAFNEPFYRLAVGLERLTPAGMKVHLVGDFVKEE
jgi:SAM-dependent methyltransferase